jgi:hypothetical protein
LVKRGVELIRLRELRKNKDFSMKAFGIIWGCSAARVALALLLFYQQTFPIVGEHK